MLRVIASITIMWMVVFWTVQFVSAEELVVNQHLSGDECQGSGGNLLLNPSFEGNYSTYDPAIRPSYVAADCIWGPCMTAQMAEHWSPFWRPRVRGEEENWAYNMPEFKPATSNMVNPVRVRTGERAQQWFTFFATHDGGIYQQVSNIQQGQSYCLSVWGHSWSAPNDITYTDPNNHGNLRQSVGIDPFGGTDWTSPNVIWTVPTTQYDEYGLFKISAVAQASQLTVFMRANPLYPVKHNDVYWDDAILINESVVATLTVMPTTASFSAESNAPRQQSADFTIQLANAANTEWVAELFPETPFAVQLNRINDQTLRITADSTGLGAGVHKGYIKIEAVDPLIPPQQIEIVLKVTQSAEASMSISRNNLSFSADVMTPTTQTGEITIDLNNVPNFQWFAWLAPESTFRPTLLPTSGDNAHKNLTVVANSAGLSAGEYIAYLRIGASDPTILGGNVTVTIKLLIEGSAETLTVSNNWFNLSAEATDATTQTVTIPIQLHTADSSMGWQATVDPTSHFIPQLTQSKGKSGESLGLIIDSRPLAPGNYTAKVIVSTTTLTRRGDFQEIVLQLTVQPPPPPPTLLMGDATYRYVTSIYYPFLLTEKVPMVIAYGKEGMQWIVRPSTNNLGTAEEAWTPDLGLTKGESGGYLTWQIDPSRLALGNYTAELEAQIDDPTVTTPPVKIKIEVAVTDIRPIFLPVIVR